MDAKLNYVLQLADTCLIHAQRLGEWCGHAPVLEEDLALSNMALDLLGQARALLTHAGQLEGAGRDEDQLAFLREERDYRNLVLVELPNAAASPSDGSGGRDFALTTLRNAALSVWLELLYERLQASADAELAGIAAKSLKEVRYHRQHSSDWVVRLGDGTGESKARMQAALNLLWPYLNELFAAEGVDGVGPAWRELEPDWRARWATLMQEAGLNLPRDSAMQPQGHLGIHSEHLGHLLATMQYLQRAYPGGAW
ncbi:1,2-phenylacetyl-CoA epoxidase subunit PaaC [Roseateles saccharophilus]|uniref:Ring-1,2-phenylacetyl-CoA epoxidase subunit PaaC n=1 Tax=Roseateles saccharophilus TaxID=304 RepID=A0A4R3UEZ5_ROSSA|nr:1,2-phenylacetyl-CoA epoxidase subunit PaaC [Roseateles saccharophilus]MDG0835068.1 phenylacetate-CoA oxygenase subunit PaaI [Roseateles saccharophilus]TCU88288.1 ring-1,2-phenylacetyl-CoA epoxidase subunit PaaC [Roseateles saccharophilus]